MMEFLIVYLIGLVITYGIMVCTWIKGEDKKLDEDKAHPIFIVSFLWPVMLPISIILFGYTLILQGTVSFINSRRNKKKGD